MRKFLVVLAALLLPVQAFGQTLKAIKDRKAIVLGYVKDAYPMSFDGEKGPDGYSVELCRRIADEAGKAVGIDKLEIKFVPLTLENRIEMVASGKVDIECSTTTVTLARMQKVDFTISTFVDAGGLAVKRGSSVRNIPSLVGESVAVIAGTTTEKALKSAIADNNVSTKVVEVASHNAGIEAV